jgi:hypothetical protein
MNRWRVGEDRGSKEKDRCPLTLTSDSFEINSERIFKLLFQMNPLILKKYLHIL